MKTSSSAGLASKPEEIFIVTLFTKSGYVLTKPNMRVFDLASLGSLSIELHTSTCKILTMMKAAITTNNTRLHKKKETAHFLESRLAILS